ncbi:MAG: amino acid adenylation domain-containing protein [Ktedonobacteraceae bacterium]|nr:amino acid adenylation domain-containing protein [Ktedonobacteraceae bacterium]
MSDRPNRTAALSSRKKELLRKLKIQEGIVSSEPALPLEPVVRENDALFPLSFAQQRLWLLDQLDPGTPIYNIPLALRLSGQLSIDALGQAITAMVQRHEALRTAFVAVDGVPSQKIMPADAFTMPIVDLRQFSMDEKQIKALELVAKDASQPFDLTTGLLLRARLLQLADDDYILSLCMHHIASDAWSIELFSRETMALYNAFVAGQPSPLPDLKVQYVDYAVWQRQWFQGDLLEKQLTYWKQQLAGAPALLTLPTDRPRPTTQTFHGATKTFHLSPAVAATLKSLSQREGVSLFMTLLSAFKIWLSHHTGQEDIVIGTPIANRQPAELEHLIGFFINTLVLRTDLAGNPTFNEVLQRVRDVTLDAFGHRELPFEMVVDALQVERNLSYSPLFQVLFTLQNEQPPAAQPAALAIKALDNENTVAKFDLLLAMVEKVVDGKTQISGNFEYNTDLFDAATIERFVERFLTLLEAIATTPEQHLNTLPWFSATERELVLHTWNASPENTLPGTFLHQFFEAQVKRTPGRLALLAGGLELSYEQVERRANQLAHILRRHGVGPEVVVGLCLPRSADLLISLLAIFKAGGAYVPLDPNYPPERLYFQLQDAQAHLLLTNSTLEVLWKGIEVPLLVLDKERDALMREPEERLEIAGTSPDQLAYIIYTSGSTGRPKGVGISHRNAEALLTWATRQFTPDDLSGVLAGTSICFDLSIFELFVPLSVGGTVILVENALHLPTGPARERITLLNTVPSVMRELVQSGSVPSSVRVVNLAGEPLPRSLVQDIYQLPSIKHVYNLYGPTEDTTYSTWELVSRTEYGTPSIGRSLAYRHLYVLDQQGEPLPIGVPGEVYLGGAGLTRGYLGQAALTAERYVPDPFSQETGARLYRTGDQAFWLPTGKLIYLGRGDKQVKLRGFRIELGEIEQRLALHPGIRECAVLVRDDLIGHTQSLVAYVVLRPQSTSDLSQAALRAFLQQTLPDYMLPAFFVVLEKLPQTPNGKIDRKALPDPSFILSQDTQEILLPRDPLEEAVAEIWQQVLGRAEIGIRENFFALGGHSLLGAQVISRIRTVLQIELPLRRLFETPTIEGLTEAIVHARQEESHLLQPPIKRVSRELSREESAIPLSFAQQRLWILDRLDPGNTTYNMPFAWNISGDLDRDALERSLSAIVARHSSLRTNFPIKNDTPVQYIAPAVPLVALPFTDLREFAAEERPQIATRMLTEEAQLPFHLATGPLWRTHLIRIDDTTHVLFLCMHHIISDGWSLNIIRRELALLYQAFAAGKASPLPDLTIQYFDYAIWQRQWLHDEVLARQLHYWKKQLAGAPDLLALPTDRPRGAVQSFNGASYVIEITPEIATGLKNLGQQAGATLFMTLFSAFQILLYRYTGQDDLVIGTPIANRTHAEIEGIIGFFVNTLALRADLSGDPSFLDVLQRVRQTVLDAFAYQDLPFEQVVEAIQPERDLARSPLIQTMFSLQLEANQDQDTVNLVPLEVSSLPIEQRTAKFDLTLTLSRKEQGLEAEFDYNTDLFDQTTIERMGRHFQVLLGSIVADPTRSIARLPLLPHAEYQQITSAWNNFTHENSTEHLTFELVEEQAARNPGAPALWDQGKILTYDELNRQANQLARLLQQNGVQPGSYVGIFMARRNEMIISMLAIFKAGAAYLPIDPSTPVGRASWMLNTTGVALVLTQKDLQTRLSDCQAPTLSVDQIWLQLGELSDENLAKVITPDYPAYIIYTSGSTGTPKGVMVNHRSLLNPIFWYQQEFGLTAADKATQLANLGFDATVLEIWPLLTIGAHLHLVDEKTRLSPTLLIPWLVKQEITVCFMPTAMVDMALHMSWPASSHLRLLLTGGDQLHRTPPEQATFKLINQYGPTENTVAASWALIAPGAQENRLPVVGRAITNTRLYVLNHAGEVQPIGIAGELFIGGKSVTQGYLGRPDLTAERFVPDPFSTEPGATLYQTGDIVRFLPDGTLEFLGRRDNQVKIRGYRIELGEIEAQMLAYPGVHDAVVVVNESLSGEKRLIAYVVAKEGVTLAKEKIRSILKVHLPDYMVPSSFSLIDELPVTSNGKVDRQALARRRPLTQSATEKHIAPRDAIELQLTQLWEQLLEVSPISVMDNFFHLGGHSLAGVRLMSQIQRLFGIDLPLSTLFEGATIAHLGDVLRQHEDNGVQRSVVEIQTGGIKPPLFCIHAAGGEVLCYMKLAHHLGNTQPVYGLQSFAIHAMQEECPSLVEMAAHYIKAIREIQPEAPYCLCGWSMGGVIAFEMARQLEEQGDEVAFLGLIDSYLPLVDQDLNERALLTQFINDLVGGADTSFVQSYAEMPDLSPEVQMEYLLQEVQRANILPQGIDVAYLRRLFTTFKKNRTAFSLYQIQSYGGRASLFQASVHSQGEQVEITHGWNRFVAHIETTHTVSGDHYSILRDPHVGLLAQHIQNSLQASAVQHI